MCIRDSTWGAQLYGDIGKWYEARKKEDNVIYIPKTEYDAFYKTDLAAVLIQNDVKDCLLYTSTQAAGFPWAKG